MPSLVRDYFDWLAGMYDEATAACLWSAPSWLGTAGGRLVEPGDWVLDLGTGTGQSSAPFLAAGARCLGLDFAREMLAAARRKHPDLYLARCDLDHDWPVPDQRFALAVSSGVFECLSDPTGCLDRVARALRPGGHLVFTFDEYVENHPVQGERVGRADSGIDNPVADLAAWHLHRHTLAQVSEWLVERGFTLLYEQQIEADVHSHFQVPIYYRAIVARLR